MMMACIGAERGPIASKARTVDEATDRVTDFLLRALSPKAGAPRNNGRAGRPAGKRSRPAAARAAKTRRR
jgi:hypothetical protein